MDHHNRYMGMALQEARKAYEMGEVPVGALIVSSEGKVLSKAHNETIIRNDPTAHAEILALRQAAETLRNYRLINTRIYVTIEPCIMCAGALIHARVEELIFGVCGPKWGSSRALYQLVEAGWLNHHIKVTPGILESKCAEIMQCFFKEKRKSQQDAALFLDPFIFNP